MLLTNGILIGQLSRFNQCENVILEKITAISMNRIRKDSNTFFDHALSTKNIGVSRVSVAPPAPRIVKSLKNWVMESQACIKLIKIQNCFTRLSSRVVSNVSLTTVCSGYYT